MNSVITAEQGKKITHGRTPHVPVEYETACKALQECLTLDEAKYWDNKADALAAWAKIYHDNKAERQARALKLWAYRRMGELAKELRPHRSGGRAPDGRSLGGSPGAQSLLIENGMTRHEAGVATRLASAKREEVATLAAMPRPPAPNSVKRFLGRVSHRGNKSFSDFPGWTDFWATVASMRSKCSTLSAAEVGRSVLPEHSELVKERVGEILEWFDEFERHLPKGKGTDGF